MTRETPYTVLVVDDHENWRNLLTQLLKSDFHVVTAEDYAEALKTISNQDPPFHVVITDLRLDDRDMADEGGLALAAAIKQSRAFTRVIVVTGYPAFESMERAYHELAIYKYLLKNPGGGRAFDHNTFRELVRTAATEAEAERGRFVFVLMPFAEEYQALYESVIKQTVEKYGILCKRADDFFQPKPIMDHVRFGIHESVFNIADLSGKSANVFYEVGLAHATQRPVLLITQSLDDVPPTLQHLRHIVYQNVPGASRLRQELEAVIEDLRRQDFVAPQIFQNRSFEVDPKLCLVLTQSDDPGCQTAYEYIIKPAIEEFGLTCEDTVSIFSTSSILDEIWRRVNHAALIIADLSKRDPDVFYLTGLCHGLNKNVILLARDEVDIPFDIRDRSYTVYSNNTFSGSVKSRAIVKTVLGNILGKKVEATFDSLSTKLEGGLPSIHTVIKEFFRAAGFKIEEEQENLFCATSVQPTWRNDGKILVRYFEEGQAVTPQTLESLADFALEIDIHRYIFVIFCEPMTKGTVRWIWQLRQATKLIFIPIHLREIELFFTTDPMNVLPTPLKNRLVMIRRKWTELSDPYADVDSYSDPQWYFGQHHRATVQELAAQLIGGKDLIVHGMRRAGKTTMINQVALECESRGHVVAIVKCKSFSDDYTDTDMLTETVAAWSQALRRFLPRFPTLQDNKGNYRFSINSATEFRQDVETISNSAGVDRTLILILDELDHIFPLAGSSREKYVAYMNFAQALKTITESHNQLSPIALVMVMEYPFVNFVDRFPDTEGLQNPLYNRFRNHLVTLLSQEDWSELVQTLGALAGLEFEESALNLFFSHVKGHAEITRRVGSCLVDLRDADEIDSLITPQSVRLALRRFVDGKFGHVQLLEHTFWEDPLSPDKDMDQILLSEIAENKEISTGILVSQLVARQQQVLNTLEAAHSTQMAEAIEARIHDAIKRLQHLMILVEQDLGNGAKALSINIPIYKDWIRHEILGVEVDYDV